MQSLNKNLIIFLISLSSVFQISTSLQAPVLSIYLLQITGDLRHIGAVMGIYLFSVALFSTVFSFSLLQYRYKLLFVSYPLFAIYCILMYLRPTTLEVYFIQAFGGLASGLGWSGFVYIFVNTVGKEDYTKFSSINRLIGRAIGAFAAAMSGFAAHYLGLQNIFLIMAVVSSFAFVVSLIASRLDAKEKEGADRIL